MASSPMMTSTANATASSPVKRQEPPEITEARRASIREAARAIINRLAQLARDEVAARAPIEQRWLNNLRAYHGRYDEITEANLRASKKDQRSRAFIKMSRAKTDAWEARLSDMLFPADDRNWGIKPTPVPELVKEAREAAAEAERAAEAMNDAARQGRAAQAANDDQGVQAAQQQLQQHQAAGQAAAERAARANTEAAEARKRAEAMQREMEDQLTECLYPKKCRDVIADLCKLGPGILKGPLSSMRPKRAWIRDDADPNVYYLNSAPDPKPVFARVDPWSFFPDSSATSMDDCEFTFERHLPSKKDLRALAARMGFDLDAVRRLLVEGPSQYADTDTSYLTQIRDITGEGQAVKNRYVMWEYHGPLESDEVVMLLRAAGRDDDAFAVETEEDALNQRLVRMFFCGGEVLALHEVYPMESGESLYSVCSFQRGEASVLGGIGVPEILADTQRVLNGAWRMMIDNGGMSAVPQTVIDKTIVEPEDGSWVMTPGKVWLKKSAEATPNAKPFETFDVTINQAQIAGIIELARQIADEECALPLIAQGDQASHITQTASGMTILSNAANIIFRRVVKNWDDDLTTPSIRRLYDWNMQFNPNHDIKGDMNVDARGTSVLLVKELQSQNLMLIAQNWTVHPVLGLMLKKGGYQVARMTTQSMNIPPDEILETEEEFERLLKTKQDNEANQQSPEMMAAKARVDVANIQAQAQLQIEQVRRDTEMMKLAESRNMTLDQLAADLQKIRMQLDSKERMFAGEAAIEDQNRQRAEAQGLEPTGSGGFISAGEQKQ